MARRRGTYFDEPYSAIATVHDEGLIWVWFCFCVLTPVDGVELLLILFFTDHRFLHYFKQAVVSDEVVESGVESLSAVAEGEYVKATLAIREDRRSLNWTC